MLIYIDFYSFPGHLYCIHSSSENHLKGSPWQFIIWKSIIWNVLFHLVRWMVLSEALTLPFYNSVNAVDLPTEHTEMNTVLAEPHCTLLSRWHFSNVWLLLLQLFPNIQEVLYPNLCWSMVNNWVSWAGGWETLIYSVYLLWWYLHPGHFHATNVATEWWSEEEMCGGRALNNIFL